MIDGETQKKSCLDTQKLFVLYQISILESFAELL